MSLGEDVETRRGTTFVDVRSCLSDPLLDVMNFLNEIVARFPLAISFAPGRPLEDGFTVRQDLASVATFVADQARRSGRSEDDLWRALGQYGRTNGIIGDALAMHLAVDENIHVSPNALLVTVGAQEAMAIVLGGLFDPDRDVLLVSNPTYVGITGIARIFNVRVVAVEAGPEGLEPIELERAICNASRLGRVRAVYDIPDFNNPLGTALPATTRLEILEVCHRYGVLFIEDNPYGMFAYDGPRLPTMKSLDRRGQVIYIGSFAKTLFPGLRLGFLIGDQPVAGTSETLALALSKVKSFLTVNTPPLLQAVAAGLLMEAGGSLERIVAPKRARYGAQRDALVAALTATFAPFEGRVSWATPGGGFFLPVKLPFEFGAAELEQCARDYGVIVCPMRFFSLSNGHEHDVRLSFSYVNPSDIATGVSRFGAFVRDQLTL